MQAERTVRLFVVAAALGLLTSSSFATGPAGDAAAQDRAAVDQVRLAFNAAFNAGDAKAMAGLADREAIWLPPGEAAITGLENIEACYAAFFSKTRSTFELHPGDIEVCGDCAYISGAFNRMDSSTANNSVQDIAGHYLFVLKKQADGSWKIARDIWNEAAKP